MNFKQALIPVCLCAVLTLSGCMTGITPLKRPSSGTTADVSNTAQSTDGPAGVVTRVPSQNTLPGELTGVRVYWSGEGNDLIFETVNEYSFRYKIFDSAPELSAGQDISDWTEIDNGAVFDGENCRNIAVAAADGDKLKAYTVFKYVPGVTYYSDEQEISEQYKYLAQSVSNWTKEDYSLGNCSVISSYKQQTGEVMEAGVTMRMSAGQPVYSPVSGEIIYCGTDKDMNMVAVYSYELNMTMIMLHMQDISPARGALEEGLQFEAGYLLGYAGRAGADQDSLYIELISGASYSSIYRTGDARLLYRQTLDPLLLSADGPVLSEDKPGYIPVGNKNSNMNNQGMAALEDDWIYYINNSKDQAIYKMRLDGTDSQEVCSDRAVCLTVSEGWIYYCKEDSDNNVYKVRVDGSDRKRLNKYHSNFITVVDDWVYFRNAKYYWRMYRMKTDGTQLERVTSVSAWGYVWHDSCLYYLLLRSGGVIYKADLSGEDITMTQLNSSTSDYITIAGDWLYYINKGKQNYIYKMRLDGSENQKAVDVRARHLNYADGWLYFNDMDNDQKLYRINTEDKDKKKELVVDMNLCIDINIAGDWLFFRTEGSVVRQYMLNLKTSEYREVQ